MIFFKLKFSLIFYRDEIFDFNFIRSFIYQKLTGTSYYNWHWMSLSFPVLFSRIYFSYIFFLFSLISVVASVVFSWLFTKNIKSSACLWRQRVYRMKQTKYENNFYSFQENKGWFFWVQQKKIKTEEKW